MYCMLFGVCCLWFKFLVCSVCVAGCVLFGVACWLLFAVRSLVFGGKRLVFCVYSVALVFGVWCFGVVCCLWLCVVVCRCV